MVLLATITTRSYGGQESVMGMRAGGVLPIRLLQPCDRIRDGDCRSPITETRGGNFLTSAPPYSCYTRGACALGCRACEDAAACAWTRHCSGGAVKTCAEILDHATALCQQCGKGRGAEVMRPPLALLLWPATMLVERGKALTAGMPVSTGSLSPPQPRSAGATANLASGGLGEAHVIVCLAYTEAGLRGTLERGIGL
jgi:hypothetical protein